VKPLQSTLLLALSFFLAACAGSFRYASDYPLSAEKVRSRDGTFSGRIPEGWFSSSDDTLAPALVAWLIRDDFSATMSVREIIPDQLTRQHIKDEGLPLLARSTMSMHGTQGSELAKILAEPKVFNFAERQFCGYELSEDSIGTRVVVFEMKGKYYECEAKPSRGKWTKEDLLLLYTAQQTFLSTLTL